MLVLAIYMHDASPPPNPLLAAAVAGAPHTPPQVRCVHTCVVLVSFFYVNDGVGFERCSTHAQLRCACVVCWWFYLSSIHDLLLGVELWCLRRSFQEALLGVCSPPCVTCLFVCVTFLCITFVFLWWALLAELHDCSSHFFCVYVWYASLGSRRIKFALPLRMPNPF